MSDLQPSSAPPPNYPAVAPTSSLAVTSLVLGIIGLVSGVVILGIPAVICGHKARKDIRRSDFYLKGDGMAVGGIVTGYIGVVLTVLSIILLVVFFGFLFSVSSDTFHDFDLPEPEIQFNESDF